MKSLFYFDMPEFILSFYFYYVFFPLNLFNTLDRSVSVAHLHHPGEVFDYLVAHGRMKEKEARAKFRQVRFCTTLFILCFNRSEIFHMQIRLFA